MQKRKTLLVKILCVILAVFMIITAIAPALAAPTTAATTAQPTTTAGSKAGTSAAQGSTRPAGTKTATTAARATTKSTTQAPTTTATEQTQTQTATETLSASQEQPTVPSVKADLEAAANDFIDAGTLMVVITGYKFPDASIDVWMSGTGIYVGDARILAPAALTRFSGKTDKHYLAIAREKAAIYAGIGLDLNDYEAIQKNLISIVCLPNGRYGEAAFVRSDEVLTLLSYTASPITVSAAAISTETPEESAIVGRTEKSLQTYARLIADAQPITGQADPLTFTERVSVSGNGMSVKVPSGLAAGCVMLDKTGRVSGIVSETGAESSGVIGADAISAFLNGTVEPESEAETTEEFDYFQEVEALQKLIASAEDAIAEGQPGDSAKALRARIEDAKKALGNIASTGEDLAEKKASLQDALDAFQNAPQKKSLLPFILGGTAIAGALAGFLIWLMKLKNSEEIAKQARYAKIIKFFGVDTGKEKPAKEKLTRAEKKRRKKEAKERRKQEKKERADAKRSASKKDKAKKQRKEAKADKGAKNTAQNSSDGAGYGGESARAHQKVERKDKGKEKDKKRKGTTLLNAHAMIPAYLTDKDGERVEVDKHDFFIGTDPSRTSMQVENNSTVSRLHCVISMTGSDFKIKDLRSTNGTYVNDVRLDPNTEELIHDGDKIVLANEPFVFHIEG